MVSQKLSYLFKFGDLEGNTFAKSSLQKSCDMQIKYISLTIRGKTEMVYMLDFEQESPFHMFRFK